MGRGRHRHQTGVQYRTRTAMADAFLAALVRWCARHPGAGTLTSLMRMVHCQSRSRSRRYVTDHHYMVTVKGQVASMRLAIETWAGGGT